jgi:hypothetical protein
MSRHNRTYTVLLIALAFFYGLGIISLAFMSRMPTLPPESRFVFQMTAWINAALVAAMVLTLILRGAAPDAGRIATKALNIVLLIAIPFGTAVAIYGLMKVDKDGHRNISDVSA